MTGKYAPLERYLESLPPDQKGVILTFQEIEIMLDKKLPKSAYVHLKWWTFETNPRSPQKQAFIKAGWRLCTVSLRQQLIEFIRQERQEGRPLRDGPISIHGSLLSGTKLSED